MGFMPHNSEQFFATFYDSGPNPWSSYPTNEPDIFSPFESHAGLTSGVPSTSTSASPGFLPVHVAASLDCAFLWNHEVSQDDTLFHPFMSYAPSLPTDGGAVYEFSSSSPSYVDGHSSGPGFFSDPLQSSPHPSRHALLSPPPYHTADYQPATNAPPLFDRNSESPYLALDIGPLPDSVHAFSPTLHPHLLSPPLPLPPPPLMMRTLVSPYNLFVDVDGVKKYQCMFCFKCIKGRLFNFWDHFGTHDPDRQLFGCYWPGCHHKPFTRQRVLMRHIEKVHLKTPSHKRNGARGKTSYA